jgi:hypothetical protein
MVWVQILRNYFLRCDHGTDLKRAGESMSEKARQNEPYFPSSRNEIEWCSVPVQSNIRIIGVLKKELEKKEEEEEPLEQIQEIIKDITREHTA